MSVARYKKFSGKVFDIQISLRAGAGLKNPTMSPKEDPDMDYGSLAFLQFRVESKFLLGTCQRSGKWATNRT